MKKFLSKFIDQIVLVISAIVSVGSLIYYYSIHLTLAYNDATSHLNIARRVIDSLTPGLVQIGSTWLPLLHILELPLIWNSTMWHTGLAGSFVSMVSYMISAYFVFKIVSNITSSKVSGFIGLLIFLTNANMVYMQTMAMFEPLLIVNALGVCYFLLLWSQKNTLHHLIYAAIFALLGSLSRYDGWFVLAGACGYVFIYTLIKKNFKKAEGNFVIFTTLAGLGVFCWFLYNLAIFGDPFYFAKNEYSAFAQQAQLLSKGFLPSKGNIVLSFTEYALATILNQGIVYSFLASMGFIYFLFTNIIKKDNWAVYLLTIPFFFNVYALSAGHSVIWLPNLPPHVNTFFNVRYGLLMLPAVAIFVGYLAKNNIWKIIILLGIVLQILLFYPNHLLHSEGSALVLSNDTVASVNTETNDATNWLSQNYKGGLILISSASSEAYIFNTGIPMKQFITEGTGHYWRESLINPSKYATYVIFFPSYSDRVGEKMQNNDYLNNNYTVVYKNQTYLIYLKNEIVLGDLPNIPTETVNHARKSAVNYPYEYGLIVRLQNYVTKRYPKYVTY